MSADGWGKHPPAFKGTFKVTLNGVQADAEITSLDGEVYAKLPLIPGTNKIDPKTFGLPDPAVLFSPDQGLTTLLTATTSPVAGDKVRQGSEVLSTITGSLPGKAVTDLFLIGDSSGTFSVTYGLTDSQRAAPGRHHGAVLRRGHDVDLHPDPRPVRPARHDLQALTAGDVTDDAAVGAATTAGTHRLALLAAASAAVALAAADTYVVVLALTDMMAGVGIGIDSLQRATPIISGFLLGYIAVLPLIGRLSDLLDRRRILLGCLLVFAVGSAVTALAVEMPVLVTGRVLQGIGGGGLVPATLALVADLWPPHRRGTPLGVVGAVQELGSVLGPVLGAIVLAWSGWRAIFWLNVAAALVLYAVIHLLGSRSVSSAGPGGSRGGSGSRSARGSARGAARRTGPCRWSAAALAVLGLGVTGLALAAPESLVTDVALGAPFVPFAGTSRRADADRGRRARAARSSSRS